MAVAVYKRLFRLLKDVDWASIADGQFLQRSGDLIIGADASAGGASALVDLTDVTGTPGTGKAPVSDGAGGFPLTDVATQAELNAEASSRASADTAAIATSEAYTDSHVATETAARAAADTAAIATAEGYTDTHVATEAAARAAADTAAIATAEGYTDTKVAAEAALRVSGDSTSVSTAEGYSDAALASHVAAADPHTGYQKESEKGAAGGYASLDGGGTVPDAQLPAALARDAEVTSAVAAEATARDSAITAAIAVLVNSAPGVLDTLEEIADALGDDPNFAATMTTALAGKQPLDSDLTALAALSTTAYGRALLELANAAALRTAAGLGTAAVAATGDFDAAGAAAAAQAASQPLDSDLTAIAALTTTSFGRGFLALADAAAGRTALGLGTLATQSGTFSGTSSGTNTGDQTSVSGNAGTATALATGRAIDGQTFDGTAAITVIAPGTHAASGKTTPVDADEVPLVDSAAANVLKKLTWANVKATLKTYFDTLYQPVGGGGATKQVRVSLSTPDASGNGYAALIATSNIREVVAAFLKDVDGDWWGIVRIPQDYASSGKIVLRVGANSTAGQVCTMKVSTIVRDTAATWDASLTAETQVDTTLSTTAYRPSDVSFTLTTTPAAGKDLLVKITHVGTAVNDTLAVDTLLLNAVFEYTT